MKKNRLKLTLILVLTAVFIQCGNTSADEASGPAATYDGSLEVTGVYSEGLGDMTLFYRYEITNTNDIGSTIEQITHELTVQDGLLNEERFELSPTLYLPGNGTHLWEVTEEHEFNGILPDSAIVTIKLIDDNGTQHYLASDYTTIIWTSS